MSAPGVPRCGAATPRPTPHSLVAAVPHPAPFTSAPAVTCVRASVAQPAARRRGTTTVAAAVAAPERPATSSVGPAAGHTALLHSLGDVGDVAPAHLPWLLRLAHIKSKHGGGDSQAGTSLHCSLLGPSFCD